MLRFLRKDSPGETLTGYYHNSLFDAVRFNPAPAPRPCPSTFPLTRRVQYFPLSVHGEGLGVRFLYIFHLSKNHYRDTKTNRGRIIIPPLQSLIESGVYLIPEAANQSHQQLCQQPAWHCQLHFCLHIYYFPGHFQLPAVFLYPGLWLHPEYCS